MEKCTLFKEGDLSMLKMMTEWTWMMIMTATEIKIGRGRETLTTVGYRKTGQKIKMIDGSLMTGRREKTRTSGETRTEGIGTESVTDETEAGTDEVISRGTVNGIGIEGVTMGGSDRGIGPGPGIKMPEVAATVGTGRID